MMIMYVDHENCLNSFYKYWSSILAPIFAAAIIILLINNIHYIAETITGTKFAPEELELAF